MLPSSFLGVEHIHMFPAEEGVQGAGGDSKMSPGGLDSIEIGRRHRAHYPGKVSIAMCHIGSCGFCMVP